MAKSEQNEVQSDDSANDIYDIEATLAEDLSDLPDETEIHGPWVLQFRGGEVRAGVSDKGPWQMLSLFFAPTAPVGDHDLTEAELDELPMVRHRMFFAKGADKRKFVEIASKMGIDAAPLSVMLDDLKGESVIATVKLGKDNRGEPEYKLSGFKAVQDLEAA